MTLISSGPAFKHLAPAVERHAAGDQSGEPAFVGFGQRVGGGAVMAAIGVDGAEHHVVFRNDAAVEATDIELDLVAARR